MYSLYQWTISLVSHTTYILSKIVPKNLLNQNSLLDQLVLHVGLHSVYTHTHYGHWFVLEYMVIKKNTLFKTLPFALKILFLEPDFFSVFPLNNLLHFVTNNNRYKKCFLFEKIEIFEFVKTLCGHFVFSGPHTRNMYRYTYNTCILCNANSQ